MGTCVWQLRNGPLVRVDMNMVWGTGMSIIPNDEDSEGRHEYGMGDRDAYNSKRRRQ